MLVPGPRSTSTHGSAERALDVNVTGIARVTADEGAFAIASVASPLAPSTTGTILQVDGGMANLRL